MRAPTEWEAIEGAAWLVAIALWWAAICRAWRRR
jgi:hypothetical protein